MYSSGLGKRAPLGLSGAPTLFQRDHDPKNDVNQDPGERGGQDREKHVEDSDLCHSPAEPGGDSTTDTAEYAFSARTMKGLCHCDLLPRASVLLIHTEIRLQCLPHRGRAEAKFGARSMLLLSEAGFTLANVTTTAGASIIEGHPV